MSLDGISSKMVIQRATELAKEVSHEQKKVEMSPFVRQMQAEMELVNTHVRDIYKPDEAVIRREEEKKKKKEPPKKAADGKAGEKTEMELPEVSPGYSKIDIRI